MKLVTNRISSVALCFTRVSVNRFTVPNWSSLPHTPQAHPGKFLKGGNSSYVGRAAEVQSTGMLCVVDMEGTEIVEEQSCGQADGPVAPWISTYDQTLENKLFFWLEPATVEFFRKSKLEDK